MDRYLKSTAAVLPLTWTVNGTPTDPTPTTTTVVVTREDGTALTSGTATRTGVGTFTFTLTSAQTADLDVLTVEWTSSLGTVTTYAEIVGGFLFSVAQARALSPLDNTTTYPTADILTARTLAEAALEDACGVPFVPRYFREWFDGNGSTDLLLGPRPLAITSATVGATTSAGGTALTADELTDLRFYRDGRVYHSGKWTTGRGNVEIKGSHGYTIAPPRVGRAALLLAKRWLVETPISDRATSLTNDAGTVEYLATTGVREMVFDIPEANAVVQEYGVSTGIA